LNLKPEGMDLINQAYHMDCIPGMKEYPDKYFDLAVVDPPYGIGVNHSMGRRKGDKKSNYKPATWDNEPPSIEYFTELFRVSKNQIVWGANHFISRMPYDSACWLMWDKKFSDDVSFAQYEMAWTSLDGTAKKFERHPSQKNRIHPTQKPIELYDWIYKRYATEGMKILDTHLGSGSNRIAAHKSNLSFVGFEIDEEHFYAQEMRFKNYLSQPSLFSTPCAVGVLNSNALSLNFEQDTKI
jgi:site-specific DNA-methyltransferase (adenine-specific)